MIGHYDPESSTSRRELASRMIAALREWGFKERQAAGGERVFGRELSDKMELRVYTSISGTAVRARDTDAIRVCLLYTGSDPERPLGKERRVHRTGVLEEIVGRVKDRIDNLTASVSTLERCRCGAPKFRSGKGNLVCAELCWKQEPKAPPGKLRRVELDIATKATAVRLAQPSPPAPVVPDAIAAVSKATAPVDREPVRRNANSPRGRAW